MNRNIIIVLLMLFSSCTKTKFIKEDTALKSLLLSRELDIDSYKFVILTKTTGCNPCVSKVAELINLYPNLDSVLYIATSDSKKEIQINFDFVTRKSKTFLIDNPSTMNHLLSEYPKMYTLRNSAVISVVDLNFQNADSVFNSIKASKLN